MIILSHCGLNKNVYDKEEKTMLPENIVISSYSYFSLLYKKIEKFE